MNRARSRRWQCGTPRAQRALACGLLLLLAPAHGRAGLIAFFGDERAGTSGGQFLRLPAGARGIAMGRGMAAAIEGAASPFWNPAGMSLMEGDQRLFVSHTDYAAEIDIEHLSYVRRMRAWQLGVSAGVLRSGDIVRTTELHPTGDGFTFEANQFLVGLSLGRMMTDRFTFAGTVKFLQENLDEFENRGVFLDLGAMYFVGFHQARVGFTVRNFGSDLRLNGTPPEAAEVGGEWQAFSAPTVAIFGFAYDFGLGAVGRRLTVTMDFNHPSDDVESLIGGAELAAWDRLFLRGGYQNNLPSGGLSAGFGLRLLEGARTLRVDYAYDDRGTLGGMHVVSLELGK